MKDSSLSLPNSRHVFQIPPPPLVLRSSLPRSEIGKLVLIGLTNYSYGSGHGVTDEPLANFGIGNLPQQAIWRFFSISDFCINKMDEKETNGVAMTFTNSIR
ncbi:hypothetical protein CEXT_589651 [Caerostris extrusa]|uniref:Uncharacterized protein n=1 Tax=Caerostris extrusa TaxID=172846 RepID=A0AAV4WIF8_CAEEX|nr:hypothetical protein CEXT_589651 [Caerostris extrusa]